jgi:uncharacterized RDD family membrane protein YckC
MVAGSRNMEASMKYSSFQAERLILLDPTDPRLRLKATTWDRIVARLTEPELIALAVFCALGLAVTVGLFFLIPGFGELAASLQAVL